MKKYAIYTWKDGQKSNEKIFVEFEGYDFYDAVLEFRSRMEMKFREEIEDNDVFTYTDTYLNYDTAHYELREV